MRRLALFLLIGAFVGPTGSAAAEPAASIDFNRDIRPILSDKCFACHGPDEGQRPTELRLDIRDSALTALESGVTAVVPGEPSQSELIVRIMTDDELTRMP